MNNMMQDTFSFAYYISLRICRETGPPSNDLVGVGGGRGEVITSVIAKHAHL